MTDHYSIAAVATMERCPVDPETFLRVRPQASISTVKAFTRRLREGKQRFPGAFKLPGDRQWSIDLVTYDKQVNKLLEDSLVQEQVEKAKSGADLPASILSLIDNDSVADKVMQKLADNQ